RDLKAELEELQARVSETERSARQDASALRDVIGSRMTELATMLHDAEMHNEECQKIIRKQSQLMSDLQNYCVELERKLADAVDDISATNNKVKSLYIQLESARRD
ncbi:paramyosin-like, partial [Tropilaelaps mercedesae]